MFSLPKIIFLLVATVTSSFVMAVPNSMTLQSKIVKPDGTLLTAPSVNFQFTTLDPLGTCTLYVEAFAGISMVTSSGVVVANLGLGSQVYSSAGAYSNIFNNQTASFPCQAGGSYVPAATDRRKIVMQFNDGSGSGWQTAQALDVNSVPFSNYAGDSAKFSGHPLTDFPLASTFPDCATTGKVLTYNGTAFTCVTAGGGSGTVTNVTSANPYVTVGTGTTTPVITANIGTVANTLAAGNDARIVGAAQKANNLSDLASIATARTNLGLGTAALLNAGAAATNLVQLDGGAKIPIALLPNLPASQITSGVIAPAQLGTGTADATTFLRGDGTWVAGSGLGYVAKAGDTMTGPLVNNSNSASTALAITQAGAGKAATFMGGNVGIGTTNPTSSLSISKTQTASNYIGQSIDMTYAPTAASAGTSIGLNVLNEVNSGSYATYDGLKGIKSYAYYMPSIVGATSSLVEGGDFQAYSYKGTVGAMRGLNVETYFDGSGVVNYQYGIRTVYGAAGAGTVGNSYGLYVKGDHYGGNTTTNRFGIYLEADTSGTITNDYGVYQATSAQRNYFAGNVGVGTINPGATLEVAGTVKITGGTPGAGKVLTSDATGLASWVAPAAGGSGTVTSVTSANADIGVATTTTTPVLTLNSGTTANQILKLDGSAKIPAVDGSLITNINPANFSSAAVLQTAYNGDIANVLDSNCGTGSTPKWNVVGDMWTCVAIGSLPASAITSGTVASARLGSGTADATTYLRGDGTWATPAGGSTGNFIFSGSTLTTTAGSTITVVPGAASTATSAGSTSTLQGGPGGSTSGAGGAVTIAGGTSTSGAGGGVSITGAAGTGSSAGGPISIISGASTGLGPSGAVTIQGGSGVAGGGMGAVVVQGSNGAGSVAGTVQIVGGTAGAAGTSTGGPVTVQGGAANATSGSSGGSVSILGANGFTGGTGGSVTINSGSASVAGFGTGPVGGAISILASASGTGTAGWNGGAGAAVSISAGAGGAGGAGANGGLGGSLIFNAGAAGATGNATGGNIVLNGGAKTGSGTDGNIILANTVGNVGVGNSTPNAKMDVTGQIRSLPYDNVAAMAINWNNGNNQYTAPAGNACGAITLTNTLDGGSYTLAVQGVTSGTCSFSQAGLTVVYSPANSSVSTDTVYTFLRMGTKLYVSWVTGFQ